MRITSSLILAVTRAFSTGIDSTDQRKIHAIKTDASRPQQVRIFAVEWDWFQCYCPRL